MWSGVTIPLPCKSAWAISYDYEESGGPVLKLVGHSSDEIIDSLQQLVVTIGMMLLEGQVVGGDV